MLLLSSAAVVCVSNVNAAIDGRIALQAAAAGGHLGVVKRLLAVKADVNAPAAGNGGRTALQVAADSGHLKVKERRLAARADVNTPNSRNHGRTVLQTAAACGHLVEAFHEETAHSHKYLAC